MFELRISYKHIALKLGYFCVCLHEKLVLIRVILRVHHKVHIYLHYEFCSECFFVRERVMSARLSFLLRRFIVNIF